MDLDKSIFTSQTSKGESLVLFYSTASVMASQMWDVLTTYNKRIFKVNIDKEKDLAAENNIRVSPIVYHYQNGEVINTYRYDQMDALLCILKSLPE